MKYLIFGFILLATALSAMAGDVIIKEADGQWVSAPDGYKAVFVPAATGDVLVEVRGVELVEPGNGWSPGEPLPGAEPEAPVGNVIPQRESCTLPGELSLGGPACESCPDGYSIEPGFGADIGYCVTF